MFKTAEVLPANYKQIFPRQHFYLLILAITCLLRYPGITLLNCLWTWFPATKVRFW